MKIVLDIPENRLGFMMELLQNFTFVKARPLSAETSDEKALFLSEFGEAVDELNEVLAGKKQGRNAYDLLDKL